MDASLDELKEFNRQQVQINARLETTLAAIKDLLSRQWAPEGTAHGC